MALTASGDPGTPGASRHSWCATVSPRRRTRTSRASRRPAPPATCSPRAGRGRGADHGRRPRAHPRMAGPHGLGLDDRERRRPGRRGRQGRPGRAAVVHVRRGGRGRTAHRRRVGGRLARLLDPRRRTAHQLSVDDSWAQELMALGTPATWPRTPQAHAITRWLGPDSTDPAARCAPTVPVSSGWLLVCSDGLWNYCSAADDLANLVRSTEATTGRDPQALAAELVRWANAQGGRDNITATLARFEALGAPATSDNLPSVAVAVDEPATSAL
ncbi:PP2C family protein-serine/threonine phosphatase [Oerskovia sp. M15]